MLSSVCKIHYTAWTELFTQVIISGKNIAQVGDALLNVYDGSQMDERIVLHREAFDKL